MLGGRCCAVWTLVSASPCGLPSPIICIFVILILNYYILGGRQRADEKVFLLILMCEMIVLTLCYVLYVYLCMYV